MNNDLSKVAKQSTIVFFGKTIGLLLGLVLNFLAAKYLGPNLYGEYIYIFTFLGMFPILILFGLQQSMVYFIPKMKTKNESQSINTLIVFSIFVVLTLGLIVSILLLITSDSISSSLLNNQDLQKSLIYMIPLLILLSISQLFQGVFRGIGKYVYYTFNQDIIVPLIKLIIFSMMVFWGFGISSLIISSYIGMSIGLIYLITLIIKLGYFRKINFRGLPYKEIFKFSFPLMFTGFIAVIIHKSDILMIGYIINEEEVGIYNIALRIGTMSSFILVAFNTIFAPMISTYFHLKQMKDLELMYKTITKWVISINLLFFSIILIFSKEILYFFGEEYVAGSIALILVAVGQVVNAGVGSAGYILVMTGKPIYEMYINIFVVIINILINFILIPIYGISGAAFASFVSVASANLIRLLLVYLNYQIHPYNISYIRVLLAIFSSSFIVMFIKTIITWTWYIEFILLSFLLAVLFSLMYFVFALDDQDKYILNRIKKRKN